MRLIDADALNKRLSEMEAEISEEDCMPGDGIISAILDIKKCIQNQEIVYDVDKVVEQLDEYITQIVGRKSALYQTVIQIVKAAGKNE